MAGTRKHSSNKYRRPRAGIRHGISEAKAASPFPGCSVRHRFRIGQVLGIDLYVDWGLFLVFWLVTFQLALSVFPAWHPTWHPALHWLVGVIAAVLFFLSILAHEFAHALVARALGLPVHSITLFLFVAGILAGRALGPGGAPDLARVGPITTLLAWLGPVNLVLAIFNLVPAFPLDGGRVFRAIVWAISGSLRRSTFIAATLGQMFGWALIALGVAMGFGVFIPVLGGGLLSGVWFALIGWFLNQAASSAKEQQWVHTLLDQVPVLELMRPPAHSVDPSIPVHVFVEDFLMRYDQRSFPVVEGDRFVGLVTLKDVRKVRQQDWANVPIREIMTPVPELPSIEPEESGAAAFDALSQRDLDQLPVLDEGRLLGIIRRKDIVWWLELHSTLA